MLADDGKEYGPASADTLKLWAADSRISPSSRVREALSGQVVVAGTIAGLFPAPPGQPPMQAPVFASPAQSSAPVSENWSGLGYVLFRCALAIFLFFFLHGIGLLIAGSAMFSAVRLQSSGSKYGLPAIVVSGITLLALGIGWLLRMRGVGL